VVRYILNSTLTLIGNSNETDPALFEYNRAGTNGGAIYGNKTNIETTSGFFMFRNNTCSLVRTFRFCIDSFFFDLLETFKYNHNS
jgi:predicted outer membrane repeat protein